jgi:aminoglycoside 2'-N-acetyltransferase I
VVVADGGAVVAHAAVVRRELHVDGRAIDTGYVEGVGTAPDRRGEGLGTLALREVDALIRRHHHLGALSTGEHGFYERLGWERWCGPTSVRTADGALVRTPDEDDGIMVLRFGPSAAVDLDAPLSCEARRGDDW